MKVIANFRKTSPYYSLNGLTLLGEIRSKKEISLHIHDQWVGGFTIKDIIIVDFVSEVMKNAIRIKVDNPNTDDIRINDTSECLVFEQFLQSYHLYKKLQFEHTYSTCI